VGIETDQGGDVWETVYQQASEELRAEGLLEGRAPRFAHAKASAGHGSKIARAERMLVDYERGKFVHLEGTHGALEAALKRFPRTKPYDLVDACLVGETIITTPSGGTPVDQLKKDDLVLGRDQAVSVRSVGMTEEHAPVFTVFTDDDMVWLTGTLDHPVWTVEEGWVQLGDLEGKHLTTRESLMDITPNPRVLSVEAAGFADVWNLEVQAPHEYFGNNILLHNCYWSWSDLADSLVRRPLKFKSQARTSIADMDSVRL
jgi:hypothetical protein